MYGRNISGVIANIYALQGRVWFPALGPAWPVQERLSPFGWLHLLLGLHITKLKAHLSLACWKRSDRQFLASLAEASAHGGSLARGEMGGIRAGMQLAYLLLPPLTFSLILFFRAPSDLHKCASIRGKLYMKKMHLGYGSIQAICS